VESSIAMVAAHIELIDDFWAGNLHRSEYQDLVNWEPPRPQALPTLDDKQDRVTSLIEEETARAANEAWNEEEWTREKRRRSPIAVLGPAGSGKSTAVQRAVTKVESAARVVIACPTARLAAVYRGKFPDLDVDTVHGAFGLFRNEADTLDFMNMYDLIILEEIGQLSAPIFDRIMRLWDAAGQRPFLVFVGDFAQLKGVDPTRAFQSHRWREVEVIELETMRRCECEILRWKLELLRHRKPTISELRRILAGHKAPARQRHLPLGSDTSHSGRHVPLGNVTARTRMVADPTAAEIAEIFQETPNTMFVTISRRAAAAVNRMARDHFVQGAEVLGEFPGDPEANVDNYAGSSQVGWAPCRLRVFKGLRVSLTKNLNKKMDFVNGMGATVVGASRRGVRVVTDTRRFLVIFPWTDENKIAFLPMRLGYATTLMKMQGSEVEHMTMWLDAPDIEAAAYVALSRVRTDAAWRFVGDPSRHHFMPSATYSTTEGDEGGDGSSTYL
jgi:hypothetical protein